VISVTRRLTSITRVTAGVLLFGLVTAVQPVVATASAAPPAHSAPAAYSAAYSASPPAISAAPASSATPPATSAAPAAKRTAIVAIGDSAASGEGAGDYEAGTRGEKGDWCHRSTHAYIRHTGLASTAVNLACSGATSANVGFGTAVHDTEGSQARRLVQIARTYRVTTIVAQFGANDDPSFGSSVVRCVVVFLNPSLPGCASTLSTQWPKRVAAMAPKVTKALGDVRAAMRQAGYRDEDYVLVVASYSSPVTETMARTHGFTGCPYRAEDAKWGRTAAVPQLSDALRGVADKVDARFLDLSRAAEGHEACTSAGPEWERRLTVDPKVFAQGGPGAAGHLAQESFHPNTAGHAQLASCLAAFVRGGQAHGQCIPGNDGKLHVEAGDAKPRILAR